MASLTGYSSEVLRWRVGDTSKPNPLFILIMNNIALESPLGSAHFKPDLVGSGFGSKDKRLFTDSAEYIVRNLLGRLSGQADMLLSDSTHALKIRIWSAYVWGLVPNGATALVGEDGTSGSTIISPRRNAVVRMLKYIGYDPDIVFIVTNSTTHTRASAYGTTDDDSRGGVSVTWDGRPLVHRYYHRIPGMAAIHVTSSAMTAAHEFGHAFSSYSNGFVTDLYVDGTNAFNRRNGRRPIPTRFCEYNGRIYNSDLTRDSLGYPSNWTSYHPELTDPARPALMDNYWLSSGSPLLSRHDKLTKAYVLDRIAAKVAR